MRPGLIGLAIGVALADSSIVTLALPDVLREFDVDVATVSWVLTSFNLALALAVLPAAFIARRAPRAAFVTGTVVFATASLLCGLAPSFEVLVGARCVQAVGAALLVTAALGLLSSVYGSDARGVRLWVAAGIFGAALGPAAGGILTEALGWESIFIAQVPLALVPLLALRGLEIAPTRSRTGRPALTANVAVLLLSGGLVAALFLLVLLLVEGWGMSPAAAGLVVTVMPVAALVATRLAPRSARLTVWIAAGIILVGGGLAALAVLPRAGWPWTIAPQLLVGAGIGLALAVLTERAVGGREGPVIHGAWTLAARHAGVVLGLLLLTPVLTAALDRNEEEAVRAGAAEVLDSGIPAIDKLRLAQDVLDEVRRAGDEGELPDVAAAFEERSDDEEYVALLSALRDQLQRAVTSAFSGPFLLAAALALSALLPAVLVRETPT